jgi:1,2-phenylacetyl-CoA epoxidase PaaB subunit
MGPREVKGVEEVHGIISWESLTVEIANQSARDFVVKREPVLGVWMVRSEVLAKRRIHRGLGGLWRRVLRQSNSGGAFGTLEDWVQSSGKRTARMTD